jgi:hypothetical protein
LRRKPQREPEQGEQRNDQNELAHDCNMGDARRLAKLGGGEGTSAMNDALTYSYKASSFGAPWEFRLKPEGIRWAVGMRSGVLRYDRIRRVRLSFRPVTMQSYRFQAEIWSDDMPMLRIASTSWRGLVEQTRQDEGYTAFILELHRRLAEARTQAQFTTGVPSVIYWLGIAVFVGVALGLAALIARALRLSEWAAVGLIGGFFVLFAWRLGSFFRRNRPGIYRPEQVPDDVLPRRI